MSYSHIHSKGTVPHAAEEPLPPPSSAPPSFETSRPSPIDTLHSEIGQEKRRLAELESSLRHFVDSNARQTRQLEAMRAQNAELSVRISTSVNDRAAAEARLARYRQEADTLSTEQTALDAVRAAPSHDPLHTP